MKVCSCFIFIFLSTFSFSQDLEKERVRWNKSLIKDSTYLFNKQPNALLVEVIKNRNPGTALDIGMGQGRNSLYLARNGWKVTGFDIADEAVAFAKKQAEKEKLAINAVLSSREDFDFGTKRWDLITYIYEGCMDEQLIKKIENSLKPHGLVVFEFFHRDAGIKMSRPAFGCESNTIMQLFQLVKLVAKAVEPTVTEIR
jgi:2-polyprenyl-3-methyl-5-hydroxy-6-metoxy-1,4-benzoquinol methylase